MTDAPKRRGKPPGSKNRPPSIAQQSTTVGPRLMGLGASTPIEDAGYAMPGANMYVQTKGKTYPVPLGNSVLEPLIEPPTIKVILSAKRRDVAFGDANSNEEVPVDWPVGWRLPQVGETVHLRKDWGGFIGSVDFDLAAQVVRLFLK